MAPGQVFSRRKSLRLAREICGVPAIGKTLSHRVLLTETIAHRIFGFQRTPASAALSSTTIASLAGFS
jgi:hypothetical protein